MENILNRQFCKYDDVIVVGDFNANKLNVDTVNHLNETVENNTCLISKTSLI